MKEKITDAIKDGLRYTVDSFAGVLSFDIDPNLTQQQNCYDIICKSALVCGIVAYVNPIPMTEFVLLTPIHAKMTLHIGKAKGFEITSERALDILRELVSAVGLSWTAGLLAGIIKFVPIVGALTYVPIIYGMTYAMGRVVEFYFDGLKAGQIPSAAELKEFFNKELANGRAKGNALSREQIDQVYGELKQKIDARERRKNEGQVEDVRAHQDEKGRGHTPLGIRIKEKPVRRPIEKTFGDEILPPPEVKVEAPRVEPTKTIGPKTPAAGVEIHASPLDLKAPALEVKAAPVEVKAPAPQEKSKLLDDLERLAKLKEVGALTPEEFETAKKKLLG
jgi:uncharacterized protein (DUF697 family)